MSHGYRSFSNFAILTATVFSLQAAPVRAGPAEDFLEGSRHNARGDVVAALPLFRRAADAGHAAAQAAFGELMRQSDFSEDAASYFQKSAAQGNPDGQFGLAAMLVTGDGVTQDLSEARKYFTAAAEQGHLLSIDELALSYLNGGLGFSEAERKSADALRWIRLSAENGFRPSMESLSKAFRVGDYGLPVDIKMADSWAEKVRKISGVQDKRKRAKKVISLEKS